MNQIIKCPNCHGTMSLPEGSRGGTFLCPSCKTPLTITIGAPATPPQSPSQTTYQSLPPPMRPSTQATHMGGQVWREATEQFVDAEQRRAREESHRNESKRSTGHTYSGYQTKKSTASSLLTGCLVIGGIAFLAVVGIVAAIVFLSGPTELALDGYKALANGSRRQERSEGDRRTVAVENRFTKSGFLIVSRDFPPGVMIDLKGYVDNLRSVGQVTESRLVQRAGLDGIRYRLKSNSAASPPHIGEIFSVGNKAIIVMYIPGREFLMLQGRTSRYSDEQQNRADAPEEFFASFQKMN